jgi:hypothetical protein
MEKEKKNLDTPDAARIFFSRVCASGRYCCGQRESDVKCPVSIVPPQFSVKRWWWRWNLGFYIHDRYIGGARDRDGR